MWTARQAIFRHSFLKVYTWCEHQTALGVLPEAGYHLCTKTLSRGEALHEGERSDGGRCMNMGGLSRGLQGEHQWKHNVSICPLAVCIVLDA